MIAKLRESAADLVGITGLCMVARGLWIGYGEAVALLGTGAILLSLAVASAARGGR